MQQEQASVTWTDGVLELERFGSDRECKWRVSLAGQPLPGSVVRSNELLATSLKTRDEPRDWTMPEIEQDFQDWLVEIATSVTLSEHDKARCSYAAKALGLLYCGVWVLLGGPRVRCVREHAVDAYYALVALYRATHDSIEQQLSQMNVVQ